MIGDDHWGGHCRTGVNIDDLVLFDSPDPLYSNTTFSFCGDTANIYLALMPERIVQSSEYLSYFSSRCSRPVQFFAAGRFDLHSNGSRIKKTKIVS
jgi:hypothetical protein